MILTLILLLTAFILIAFLIAACSVGGAAFLLIFGDVVVCIFILIWLAKILSKK